MFVIILSLVLGAIMFFKQYKEAQEQKAATEEHIMNIHYEKYDYSAKLKYLAILVTIVGIISSIYGIVIADEATIAMGFVIIGLFGGELFIIPYKYVLYYNDKGFVANGKYVRYKSIKQFNRIRNIKFAFVKVETISGEQVPVSAKSYEIINEHYLALTTKKK